MCFGAGAAAAAAVTDDDDGDIVCWLYQKRENG